MSGFAVATGAASHRRGLPWATLARAAASLLFGAVLVAQLAHHALWRDELNAWAIALASPTLPDLFRNLHYDGHPGLWHLLLWLASWLSAAPETVQVVHGAIGLALIGLIIWRAPFAPGETLLLLLSYFVLFEYTVVSRNYGIGMLLALIFAERRASHPAQLGRNAALLGLLANTNVFALLLSGAFAVEYGLDRRGARQCGLRAWLLAGGIYGGLLVLAVATMAPAADMSWRTAGRPFSQALSWHHLLQFYGLNLSALLPLQPDAFWRMHPDSPESWRVRSLFTLLIIGLSPVLAWALWRIFAARPRLLLIPGLTFVAAWAFTHLIYPGDIRHWGVNFVATIAALWILRRSAPGGSRLVLGLLGINALAGVFFAAMLWRQPFSHAADVAAWLRAAHLEDATLLGTPDTDVAPVAILLGRTMTFLDCDCTDSYARYLPRREDFSPAEVPARLERDAERAGPGPVLFITSHALTTAQLAALDAAGDPAREEVRFDGARTDENYVVYRIEFRGNP